MTKSPVETDALARGILSELSDERLVLAVPGTDYQLHLVPTVKASKVKTPVGKRIKGTIEARSLRIHPARGGGRFVEPVYGAPRIVAGTVIALDEAKGRVLVNVAVPMWVSWPEGQDLGVFEVGGLVNFYVESGATFTPA